MFLELSFRVDFKLPLNIIRDYLTSGLEYMWPSSLQRLVNVTLESREDMAVGMP